MKPFIMTRPDTVREAARQLAAGGAQLLAGGQDLLTELDEHLVAPEVVVNLKGIPGLDGLRVAEDGALELGALVTLERLADAEDVRATWPALAEASLSVGSPQIRSQATLGGNLNQRPRCWYYRSEHAHCLKKGGDECLSYYGRNKYNAILGGGPSYIVHPSDLAPALVAYGAEVTLVGAEQERVIPLEDYYTLPSEGDVTRETVRDIDEVLTLVRVPAPPPGLRSTYLDFKERQSFDFAMSAVALAYRLEDDALRDVRLVLGGVAPKPWRCHRTERKLKGRPFGDETVRLAAQDALADASPLEENGYKVPLTKGLIQRAFERLGGPE